MRAVVPEQPKRENNDRNVCDYNHTEVSHLHKINKSYGVH